ncbi:NAD-dependent epimerase [Flavobacterium psychrophilum]|nr:NAD-dependent epimerase [Flavobacterium psychrophilum]AOE52478.1 NAD-dependent epimerase [Flavobacterium psychrophilum]
MILVTGGTGLVGAHLLLHLAGNDKKVRALYRSDATVAKTRNLFTLKNNPNFEKIEWVKGDINDIPSLEDAFLGIDTVYHCAAYISFEPKDEDILRKVNIEGTANMVNCALDFGVTKFCHVSSIAALGDAKDSSERITEETEWNPEVRHGDYAISKYGAEMEVWRAWQEGLNVVIVNPGLIFGEGFWDAGSGKIFKAVHGGQYFYTKGTCGIVAVEDVVKAMIQLVATDTNGERYTIVANDVSYKEMLDTIADGMKKSRPGVYASPWLTSVAWRMDWLFSKLLRQKRKLTRSMAKSSHNFENYDNSKIVSKLNFTFLEVVSYLRQLSERYPS